MIVDNQTEKNVIPLRIRPRGNFRLSPNNCSFPPLSLRFKKKEVKGSIFEGQKRLKLVTHCQDEQYVLKEYLAYKIFNLITPNSFQVRLARITYNDVDQVQKPFSRYAFIIESNDALADRIGGKVIDRDEYVEELLDREHTALLYTYQYLIANRDWEIEFTKNIDLIRMPDYKILAIPFDFDFTGWVDAPYVRASLGSMFEDPGFRVLRNLCRTKSEWEGYFKNYNSKKQDFTDLISNFNSLSKKERNKLLEYVDSFIIYINDPEKLNELVEDCG